MNRLKDHILNSTEMRVIASSEEAMPGTRATKDLLRREWQLCAVTGKFEIAGVTHDTPNLIRTKRNKRDFLKEPDRAIEIVPQFLERGILGSATGRHDRDRDYFYSHLEIHEADVDETRQEMENKTGSRSVLLRGACPRGGVLFEGTHQGLKMRLTSGAHEHSLRSSRGGGGSDTNRHNRGHTFGTASSAGGRFRHHEVQWREPDGRRALSTRTHASGYWRGARAQVESTLYERSAGCYQRGRAHGGQEYAWPCGIGSEDGSIVTAGVSLRSRVKRRVEMDAKASLSVQRVSVQKANRARTLYEAGGFLSARGIGKKRGGRGSIPEPPAVRTRAKCPVKMPWESTYELCGESYDYTHRRSLHKQGGGSMRATGGNWLWRASLVRRRRGHITAQMVGAGGPGTREWGLARRACGVCAPRGGEGGIASEPGGGALRVAHFTWGGVGPKVRPSCGRTRKAEKLLVCCEASR
jgi:hypothetical protein